MPTAKNASYQILEISIIFRCSECREKLPTTKSFDLTWTRQQIWEAGQFHEMNCPKCSAINKFPAKLINALVG